MVTVVLILSRKDELQRILSDVEGFSTTNVLIVVDGSKQLYLNARNSPTKHNRLVVHYSGKKILTNANIDRRKRIAKLHSIAQQNLADASISDYVLLIEDDGQYPINTIEHFLDLYKQYPDAGFISGVQVGRRMKYIGAWKFDNPADPKTLESVYHPTGVHPVHSAGFYCMMLKQGIYVNAKIEPMGYIAGPDIEFGRVLSQTHTNYVDFDFVIPHHGSRWFTPDNVKTVDAKLKYEYGRWRIF